jgi:glycosyltransferase involved in cell wall biosynthesis
MGRFFLNLRKIRKDAFLRVLTTSPASDVATRLGKIGLTEEEFWVGSVNPPDVPDYLRRASLGISFRKPTFSQIAASPTKIPEYLASGLPVICNSGIGDIDKLISKEGVGVIIKGFTDSDYQQALRQLEDMFKRSGLRHHCRKVAKEYFDLHQVGGVKYCSMYRRLV